PQERRVGLSERHHVKTLIIFPVRFQKRSVTLRFGTSQNEIVRKAIRHTFDTKKSVLYCEIALNRIDVIPHVHTAEIAESRVAKKEVESECSTERQKQRGKISDGLSVEQTNCK